jgi:ferredoxin
MEVCPVDCFYEGDNMLVIKPDECIDCGVCEPECPVDAIKSDIEKGASDWVEHNTKYSELWPNITKKREEDVPKDQEKWRGVKDKLKYFSEKPGKGS